MSCNPSELIEGTTPVFTLTFRDVDDDLADPTSVTVVHRAPDGTETTYTEVSAEITNPSVGVWRVTLPAAVKGRHVLNATGVSGSWTVSSSYRFRVKADGIPNP